MTSLARRVHIYGFGVVGVVCAMVSSATAPSWVSIPTGLAALACVGWALHLEVGKRWPD